MMYSIGPNREVVGHRVTRVGPLTVRLNGVKYTGGSGIYVTDAKYRPIGTPGLMWDSLVAVNQYRFARADGIVHQTEELV